MTTHYQESDRSLDTEELIEFEIERKWGFKNKQGEIIVEPQFDRVKQIKESLLVAVKLNNKWGFANKKGEIIIQPQFDDFYVHWFSDQRLIGVKLDNKWGFINRNGKIIVEPQFEEYDPKYTQGLIPVKIKIEEDLRQEAEEEKPIRDRSKPATNSDLSKTLNLARILHSIGLGIKSFFSDWKETLEYINEGEVTIVDETKPSSPVFPSLKEKWGYINEEGVTIVPFQFDEARPFRRGLAVIKVNDKYGYR